MCAKLVKIVRWEMKDGGKMVILERGNIGLEKELKMAGNYRRKEKPQIHRFIPIFMDKKVINRD